MDENKPRRRWLRFGIRDLLWAMVVVGLLGGWGIHWRSTREARQLQRDNEVLRRDYNALTVQLELHGYTVMQSSIGPFLQRSENKP